MTTNLIRTMGIAVFVVVIVILCHQYIGNNLFSFAPAPFILSIIITHLTRNRLKLLIVLAFFSEMFSFFPPGIMTAIILAPWFIRRFTYKVSPDISPSFLLVVAVTLILQTALAFGYEIIYLLIQEQVSIPQIHDILPYTTILMIIGVSTLIACTICIVIQEWLPVDQRNTTIFLQRKSNL